MSTPDPIDYGALPTLRPKQALALWQQGKDAWNTWVEENPDYNVSFEGVTFPNGGVSFTGFRFPRGRIIFIRTDFGSGNVLFDQATFGDGEIFFDGATFGTGRVSFFKTTFGNGDVRFEGATFGNGSALFQDSDFGDGDVSFLGATFGTGTVSFDRATFGDGEVLFRSTRFGTGQVLFISTRFGTGRVSFHSANFGDGDVSFRQTNFGDSEVLFERVTFGKGDVNFHLASMASGNFIFYPASLGKGTLSFSPMSFPGRAVFKMKGASELESLSFKRCSFAKVFELRGKFNCVPDLRSTGTPHHVDLSDLTCDFPRDDRHKAKFLQTKFLQKAAIRGESARLRRLKELAESTKHHAAALRFNALEMRAARWTEYGLAQSFLDLLYEIFSDYGRSILRPVVSLLVTIGGFSFLFAGLSPAPEAGLNAFALSLSNCLPFLPLTRDLHQTAAQALGISPELLVGGLSLFEGVLAFLFLFLIGLGLRNRFRL